MDSGFVMNSILFSARSSAFHADLWITDGMPAGTFKLMEISTDAYTTARDYFPQANGNVLFVLDNATAGSGLWRTDGTPEGTVLLHSVIPVNTDSFFGTSLFVALDGGRVIFQGADGDHGVEPWVSDGTAAGTVLLKDFAPGADSSDARNFFAMGDGRAIFTATDAANGNELWITDGTEAGTSLLKDINSRATSSGADDFYQLGNGKVIFSVVNAPNDKQLWITDGTSTGTVLLKDVFTGSDDFPYTAMEFFALGNGTGVFTASDAASGTELWVTDGTDAGTFLLKDVKPGAQGSLYNGYEFFALGDGRALFHAADASGDKVWVTDGTDAGTLLLKDILPGVAGGSYIPGNPFSFSALGDGRVVFFATDAVHGREVWVTDGTAAGTALVKDIFPGSMAGIGFMSVPLSLGNGKVVFTAMDAEHGEELWVTDGTTDGTMLLQDMQPGAVSSQVYGLVSAGPGLAAFTVGGGSLWMTDGTASGTWQINESAIHNAGSIPSDLFALGNGKFVFGTTNTQAQSQLWVTDGTTAGTTALQNIEYWWSAQSLAAGRAIFVARDDEHGAELWATDGTASGTTLLQDIDAGTGGSFPVNFESLGNGKYIFSATDATHGTEMWATDGSAAGTVLLADIYTGPGNVSPGHAFSLGNGTALFTQTSTSLGRELWITDGTAAGTSLVLDGAAGDASSYPESFALLHDGLAVFSASDVTQGYELWITDGTAAGTHLLKDINAGDGHSFPNATYTLAPDKVLFSATDGSAGTQLWITDGSDAGTVLLKVIDPGAFYSYPYGYFPVGESRAMFFATTAANGTEVWVTDGTTSGTQMLLDINPGIESGLPNAFHAMGNGRYIFSANDGVHGSELWVTDTTAAGTYMLSDINVGIASSVQSGPFGGFHSLTAGKALFSGSDATHGYELWVTDGTVAGTYLVKDIAAGDASANIRSFAALENGWHSFVATDSHGDEVWITDGTAENTMLLKDINLFSPDLQPTVGSTLGVVAPNLWPTGTATGVIPGGTGDAAIIVSQATLTAGLTDPDGGALHIEAFTASHAVVADNGDSTWTITPDAGYNDVISLAYRVVDVRGGYLDIVKLVDVGLENRAPELTGSQATLADGSEDAPYVIAATDLLAGFTDADGDTLSVSNLVANHGAIVVNGDGTFTLNPTANFHGSVVLTYNVVDGQGGVLGAGSTLSLAGTAEYGSASDDVMTIVSGKDTLYGGDGNDALQGANAADVLHGGIGTDSLLGARGADVLKGNRGDDVLDGGLGRDRLGGGKGSDTLTGGELADTFVFRDELGAYGIDTITDFASGSDWIRIMDGSTNVAESGRMDASRFALDVATTAAHRFIYNSETGALYYDADGSGSGAAVQFAVLSGAPSLVANDFVL